VSWLKEIEGFIMSLIQYVMDKPSNLKVSKSQGESLQITRAKWQVRKRYSYVFEEEK
jgi:hypothetical protein